MVVAGSGLVITGCGTGDAGDHFIAAWDVAAPAPVAELPIWNARQLFLINVL
jgi:hypothetical protein